MEFVRYAERGATLLNAPLGTLDDVRDHLIDRDDLSDRIVERDGQVLRRFQRELRPVFDCSADGDQDAAIEELNTLLARHPITAQITRRDTAPAGRTGTIWRLDADPESSSVADLLIAETLLGLASLACDLGPGRLGMCQASPCEDVFVDISPNQSRRYCSDRCSSRANVAAYRARRKARAVEQGQTVEHGQIVAGGAR